MGRCLISRLVLCTSLFWLVYCLHENCDTNSDKSKYSIKRKEFGIEENERRILLIGKTGVGKSTTGNTILGYEAFKTGASIGSVTSQIKVGKGERYGRNLLVVDTPGLYDTSKTNEEIMTEIAKCYGVTTPGFHAIVFVIAVGQFTNEENKTLELYNKYFGENISKYMILAFTGKDKLERDGRTIENYINNIPKSSKFQDFKNLLKTIQNRYMVFGLNDNKAEREDEVIVFLNLIDKINEMNGYKYYINEMYIEAERIMNERLAEEHHKLQEKHEAEFEALKESIAEKSVEIYKTLTKRKYFGIEDNERRILLIGKTGVGKSTTGNTILGYEAFKAGASFSSVTSHLRVGKAERYGRNLLVVDTPGMYDTGKTTEEVMIEIAKCYGVTTPGLHAIVFVMEVGRFTAEENKTIELYRMFFGENLSKYMILVFTGKDKLERDGKTIQSYVNNIPNSSEFKDFKSLLKSIQNRYIAFGLKGNIAEREEDVKYFLDLIDEVNEMNGDNYYTNEMYMEAEKVMNKRLAQEHRQLQEKHEAEIEELKKSMAEFDEDKFKQLA